MGLDVLVPLGIDISCSTQRVTWMQAVVPFRPQSYFDDSLLQDPIAHSSHCLAVNHFDNPVDLFNSAVVTPLLSSKYERVDTTDIAMQQRHHSKRPTITAGYSVR